MTTLNGMVCRAFAVALNSRGLEIRQSEGILFDVLSLRKFSIIHNNQHNIYELLFIYNRHAIIGTSTDSWLLNSNRVLPKNQNRRSIYDPLAE